MILNETPTLTQVIESAIARYASNLHTSMPASIVTYDRATQKASIQPLLQRKTRDGVTFSYPVITNVPCLFSRTGVFSMTYELKPGDTGLIMCSERSLDRWLTRGGIIDPNDPRKHDINDAVFLPGLFPFSKPAPAEQNIAVLQNDKTRFRVYEDGRMAFENLNSNEELIKILVDTLNQLINSLITTGIGPQPFTPSSISAFQNLKSRLETLQE